MCCFDRLEIFLMEGDHATVGLGAIFPPFYQRKFLAFKIYSFE